MEKQDKIAYRQLKAGFELPCRSYQIKPAMIADYLRAVDEDDSLYHKNNAAPPMAVAAYAMNAIADSIVLPPGVVHSHGQIEFLGRAKAGDIINCYGTVNSKLERGSLHFLTIDFSIQKRDGSKILKGKTSLLIPAGKE
ncbi:MaoC family dehydratase N-terminal domain-containing protein [Chloroflexota bacterium]